MGSWTQIKSARSAFKFKAGGVLLAVDERGLWRYGKLAGLGRHVIKPKKSRDIAEK
jgi:hypothetical protein